MLGAVFSVLARDDRRASPYWRPRARPAHSVANPQGCPDERRGNLFPNFFRRPAERSHLDYQTQYRSHDAEAGKGIATVESARSEARPRDDERPYRFRSSGRHRRARRRRWTPCESNRKQTRARDDLSKISDISSSRGCNNAFIIWFVSYASSGESVALQSGETARWRSGTSCLFHSRG